MHSDKMLFFSLVLNIYRFNMYLFLIIGENTCKGIFDSNFSIRLCGEGV